MRLIIDKLGSGHHDIFLKIDVLPEIVKVADSYYLGDFFGLDTEYLSAKVKALINYWETRIKSIDKEGKVFLPFELCDEYVGGVVVCRNKIGFILEYAYTQQLHGYAIGRYNLDEKLSKDDVVFEVEGVEHLISKDLLLNGFKWSLEELGG
jgi:hypothetical protein